MTGSDSLKMRARWDRILLGTSCGLVLVALTVLIGWHLHIRAAVQVFPGLIPVQYKTALCFLALGAAGVGLALRKKLLELIGGLFAALMGAAVILEYATGRAFGIDALFFTPWERNLSADPGRMALTTAIGFVLAGSSLVAISARPKLLAQLGIINATTLSLALTSLMGYAFGITYVLPFQLGSQMALLTAAALFAYGLAALGFAWVQSERGPENLPRWVSGLSVTLVPVLFVGIGTLFPQQSWNEVPLELLFSVFGVALVAWAVSRLATAKVAYKGLLMIATPLILLLVFVGLVAHVKHQSESAQAWTLHSREVMSTSQSLVGSMAEAQSAVRGFLISGDERSVTLYSNAVAAATQTLIRLRTLVADNPVQLARAEELGRMEQGRMELFQRAVGLVRAGQSEQVVAIVRAGIESGNMLRIAAAMDVFSREETRLGRERERLLSESWQRLNWLLVSGSAGAVLLAGILIVLFGESIGSRLQLLQDNAFNLAAGRELALPLSGHDEIARVDRVFREMASALQESTKRASDHVDARHADAMRKTGALQSAIFNSANFSCIATDAGGVIQIFNVGAERMLGYTAGEVMNRNTPADISDPYEVIARARSLTSELATPIAPGFEALVFKASRGIEDIYELTYIRKDGSRFPAVVSVTALRDAEDEIIGYLLIGTDNTVRKQMEEERQKLDQRLRDQQFYTRSLFESNIDALMATDSRGIITDVNRQTEALTGCTRVELIGAPFKNYFTDPGRAEAGIHRVLNEGKVSNYELTVRSREGRVTVVSYNASTFYDRDRSLKGVFAAARDVTELKRFERTLQQKNVELEAASRMKSEFLANMSHELRTPLNAIIGFSEVLRDGLMGNLTDQQRGFIGDIFNSGTHLLSLINDILDLSKVEAGKMTLELEPVQITALVSNSLSIIREKAAARRIQVSMDVAEADLGPVHADGRKVKQIVYNLLSNAVKFSREDGKVELRARPVPRSAVGKLSGLRLGRRFPLADSAFTTFLEISVTDNGLGIAPDGLAHLFKPFSQVDSSLARKFEGTGLGLAMVKLLAELHGGSVAVESAVGEGSCFTVWLPLRASILGPPSPTSQPLEPEIESPRPRIALVVEDDVQSANLIRVQLEAEGFRVLHALSAESALEMAIRQPLSLITLDIMLPNMDGWEFLGHIKDVPSLARVPVVIISIVADANKGFALGASAVLEKPISRQELYESLTELGLFPRFEGRELTVLVVDDDPRAVELIAVPIAGLASTVLRAYGGEEAIETAQRDLPDLIILDLMMPNVSGFDVVEALKDNVLTARIPVVVVTSKQITAADRDQLNGGVMAIMDTAAFDHNRFVLEIRRAMAGRRVAA